MEVKDSSFWVVDLDYIDIKLQNPFTISGYAGEEYFCDSVKETV